MNASQYIDKDALDVVIDNYIYIANRIRNAKAFHSEEALQSATASVFIEYNKSKGSVTIYTNKLKQRLAELEQQNHITDTWFAFLDEEFADYSLTDKERTQIKSFIIGSMAKGDVVPDSVRDYIIRIIDHRLNDEQRKKLFEEYDYLYIEDNTQMKVKADSIPESDNDDAPGLTEVVE